MKTIIEILQEADDECESANYHDMIGLARDIYNKTKHLVPVGSKRELAQGIAEGVISCI